MAGVFVAGSCPQAGTYTNTWTVTDDCGNVSAVYTQVITIIRYAGPDLDHGSRCLNMTLQCSDAAGLSGSPGTAPGSDG